MVFKEVGFLRIPNFLLGNQRVYLFPRPFQGLFMVRKFTFQGLRPHIRVSARVHLFGHVFGLHLLLRDVEQFLHFHFEGGVAEGFLFLHRLLLVIFRLKRRFARIFAQDIFVESALRVVHGAVTQNLHVFEVQFLLLLLVIPVHEVLELGLQQFDLVPRLLGHETVYYELEKASEFEGYSN